MLFNAEVKYAKLKMKINEICINLYRQFTVTAIIAIHLLIGLKFYRYILVCIIEIIFNCAKWM